MKSIIKFLSVVTAIVLLLCNMQALALDKTPTVILGNTNITAGDAGRITITVEDFDDFVGGFNFEIKFPESIQITDVYLGEDKLTSLADGGSDYNVNDENVLTIADTCNYGDGTTLSKDTVYYVYFNTMDDILIGEYSLEFTEDTFIVADSSDEDIIIPQTVNGKINVIGLKADIDESGSADATDAVILRKRLLGKDCGTMFNEIAADVNTDGTLNIKDLVALKKYFVRMVVYLSDNGDDSNSGDSENASVATLNRALEQVYEGGTIYITDTYTVDSSFIWKKHLKAAVISGGTLDATAVSDFKIADNISFTDITLNFKQGANVYANGCELVIDDNVTVSGKPNLYGGGTTTVKATSMEINSGSYQYIYGGGKNSDVVGNTNIVIGGNVNSDLNAADHNGGVYIVGGCENGAVGGNTNLTVGGNAKSTYIIGAGIGANSNVLGKTQVEINGGTFMGAYAGSTNGKCTTTVLTLNGGTIEQVFGGNENASMTGNTRLNILGGTVTRRIYGGCYNNVTSSGEWQKQYHVSGNTTVYLSSNANVKFGSFNDYGIFACSRYKSHFDDENSTIIYEDSAAASEFGSSLGQQDVWSTITISWPSAAKIITSSAEINKESDNYASYINYRGYNEALSNKKYSGALSNTYKKLSEKEEVNVVYFGGSVTYGYGSEDSDQKGSWRVRVGEWLSTTFPKVKINNINRAIGDTGTNFGIFRLNRDVISQKPDLLFIEFSINDYYEGIDYTSSSTQFETIIRTVKEALPECDIVTILVTDRSEAPAARTTTTETGELKAGELHTQAKAHEDISKKYNIPSIHVGRALADEIFTAGDGVFNPDVWKEYVKDGVHPKNKGYDVYYNVIKEFLTNSLWNGELDGCEIVEQKLPEPVNSELLYGEVTFIDDSNVTFTKNNGATYSPDAEGISDRWEDGGYKGVINFTSGSADTVSVKFTGTELVMVVKSGLSTSSSFEVSIDGGTTWTECSYSSKNPVTVLTGLPAKEYTAIIRPSVNSDISIDCFYSRNIEKAIVQN